MLEGYELSELPLAEMQGDDLGGRAHRAQQRVGDYGIALAEGHGAGLSHEEFVEEIGKYNDISSEEQIKLVESGEYVPSYMWNQNGWLASKMGLHVTSQKQECLPTTWDKDLDSSTLGMTIKAGDPTAPCRCGYRCSLPRP